MTLLVSLVFLCVASATWAAPTVIGTPVAADIGASVGTSLTFAATCPNTGTNRVAIACAHILRGGTISITSYTWAGVAMTFLGAADNATDGPYSAVYLLKNPICDGASHNAVITMAASPNHMIVGNIVFLQDVDQTNSTDPVVTATGTALPVTVSVNSAVDDFVIDCASSKNSNANIVKDASQTLQSFDQTSGGTPANNVEGGMSSEAGASPTVTMSWGGAAGVGWAIAGVSVNPVVTSTRRRVPPPTRLLRFWPMPFFYGSLDHD